MWASPVLSKFTWRSNHLSLNLYLQSPTLIMIITEP